jgi:hypothetical protein
LLDSRSATGVIGIGVTEDHQIEMGNSGSANCRQYHPLANVELPEAGASVI